MNFRLVAEQWDRIGKFYAAFPAGHATTSAALQRLNRFQASNRFYAANRELGRALKTEFVLQQLRKHRGRSAFRVEEERRQRLVGELRQARLTGIPREAARRVARREAGKPARGRHRRTGPDRGAVRRGEDAVEQLYALAHALVNDYERFEELVDRGAGGGEAVTE